MLKEFAKISKTDWLQKYRIAPRQSPFLGISQMPHLDDHLSVINRKANKDLYFSEKIKFSETANHEILAALNGGANAISILFDKVPNSNEFQSLFKDVFLDIIPVNFELENFENIEIFLIELNIFLEENDYKKQNLALSIYLNSPKKLKQILALNSYLKFILKLSIEKSQKENQIIDLLIFANEIIKEINSEKLPQNIVNNLIFELELDNAIYWNIAKINALEILWLNILQAYELKGKFCIKIMINSSKNIDPYKGHISSVIQALTALNCNINYIEIAPILSQLNTETSKRITKNIANILVHEAKINTRHNAFAGSYFIENLTKKFAEKVWKTFILNN